MGEKYNDKLLAGRRPGFLFKERKTEINAKMERKSGDYHKPKHI